MSAYAICNLHITVLLLLLVLQYHLDVGPFFGALENDIEHVSSEKCK